MAFDSQKTLQRSFVISGTGLFTGKPVRLTIAPAAPDTGIVFQRIDLPHAPSILASLVNVYHTDRSTWLAVGSDSIMMVEHLLSALSALGVDNAHIFVDGPEVPVCDGSARIFVDLIEEAGLVEQGKEKKIYRLNEPLSWSSGDIHLVAVPSEVFRVSYMLHYPHSSLLGSQYFSCVVSPESYRKEIAPCRTFALYEEITCLMEKGILRGGNLDVGVVIQGEKILNPEGLRFSDEMVRHKIQDLIGDFSLLKPTVGSLVAHLIAIRSGHTSNVAFGKIIEKHFQKEMNSPKLACVSYE